MPWHAPGGIWPPALGFPQRASNGRSPAFDAGLLLRCVLFKRCSLDIAEALYVHGVHSLWGLLEVKLYFLPIAKVFARNLAVMDENILAPVMGLDESVSFLAAEPLNCSFWHTTCWSFISPRASPALDAGMSGLGDVLIMHPYAW